MSYHSQPQQRPSLVSSLLEKRPAGFPQDANFSSMLNAAHQLTKGPVVPKFVYRKLPHERTKTKAEEQDYTANLNSKETSLSTSSSAPVATDSIKSEPCCCSNHKCHDGVKAEPVEASSSSQQADVTITKCIAGRKRRSDDPSLPPSVAVKQETKFVCDRCPFLNEFPDEGLYLRHIDVAHRQNPSVPAAAASSDDDCTVTKTSRVRRSSFRMGYYSPSASSEDSSLEDEETKNYILNRCSACHTQFKDSTSFRTHNCIRGVGRRHHHNLRAVTQPSTCDICQAFCKDEASLRAHFQRYHASRLSNPSSSRSSVTRPADDNGSSSESSADEVNEAVDGAIGHDKLQVILIGKRPKAVVCKICLTQCKNEANYKKHIKRYHKSNGEASAKEIEFSTKPLQGTTLVIDDTDLDDVNNGKVFQGFKCNFCSRVFNELHHLRSHGLSKHAEVYNPTAVMSRCSFCPRTFRSDTVRKQHEITHSRPQNVTCKVCGEVYYSRRELNVHMEKHNNNHDCQDNSEPIVIV